MAKNIHSIQAWLTEMMEDSNMKKGWFGLGLREGQFLEMTGSRQLGRIDPSSVDHASSNLLAF